MLKDLSSIRFQGANFSSMTALPIFSSSDGKKYAKASLLYGRNGSGKSTIAKAFRKIKGEDVPTVITADILDKTNQSVTLSKAEQAGIFVFDEDYVTANVRIERKGLDSIVMLGEQAEKELEQAEALVKTTENTLKEYQDMTNPKAPSFYINKIHNILQRDDGWAGRDSKARGLRQNSKVYNNTYKRFINLHPEKTRDELIVAFNSKMKELEAAQSGASAITEAVPSIPDAYKNYSITLANELIKKKIEKPELSDREKYLFSLLTAGKADELQARIDQLNDETTTFCPYCLQDLTRDYKSNLVVRIQQILSDEVKRHQNHLKALTLNDLILELSSFSSLPSYKTCVELTARINKILQSNNALLQRKIDDSYSPIINEELSEIGELIQSLGKALKTLEAERAAHNSNVSKTKPIVDELVSINDQIAYYDVKDFAQQLDKQNNEMAIAEKAHEDAVADRTKKKDNLEKLNSSRKRIDIAIDIINKGLKYIFFAENRLAIERDGDAYKILSNGRPVLPKNVSVGERNIIGLCYFFTSIMTGKNQDTAYSDEYLLVIDDPVSSYDFENKVGILSFLKYKLSQFLNGNASSRAIIMTHDLLTLFDLKKIFQDVSSDWERLFSGQAAKHNLLELKNCALKLFKYGKRQEYTALVKLIYDYGCGEAGEYDIIIGNIMRQALEAFTTFEYKKGITDVLKDETLLSEMCDEHKSYFKNLICRIVLNNGSHREEQTKSMEIDFLPFISEKEKRRTAQEIISLIYLLNKPHILAHLGDVSSKIDRWCEEIKDRAV